MSLMFNIENDNKTYRISCLSTRSMNPQHLIGVGGPVTPLTEPEATKTLEKGPRRRRRNRKDRCSGGGGGGGGGDGGGGGGGGGGGLAFRNQCGLDGSRVPQMLSFALVRVLLGCWLVSCVALPLLLLLLVLRRGRSWGSRRCEGFGGRSTSSVAGHGCGLLDIHATIRVRAQSGVVELVATAMAAFRDSTVERRPCLSLLRHHPSLCIRREVCGTRNHMTRVHCCQNVHL